MNEQNRQLAKRIDQYIVAHIGYDSPLYGKLNFDQREMVKMVYKICDTFVALLIEDTRPSTPPEEKPTPKAKTSEIPNLTALSVPALFASAGAFAGSFLSPRASMSALCGLVCGAVGVLAVYVTHKPKNLENQLPLRVTEEPAKADEDAILEEITMATNELLEYVGKLSHPKDTGHDVRSDSHFAKWVQKVMSAVWKADDRLLKVLVTDELDTRLSEMGLFVCTEPEFADGKLAEPYDRLFTVRHKDGITEPKVTLPAVCIGESALAKGELFIP